MTFGLPVIITNCSNNIGPFQYPEKLVPSSIRSALKGDAIPIYGDGTNVRDWLYVLDHADALVLALKKGKAGRCYNFGGNSECANIDLVDMLCEHLDALRPRNDGRSYREQVEFVDDRAGHDFRYAVDSSRARKELGWQPKDSLGSALEKTLMWYLENPDWLEFK
jgi:dTDP-glucose 4,6-dehydratase